MRGLSVWCSEAPMARTLRVVVKTLHMRVPVLRSTQYTVVVRVLYRIQYRVGLCGICLLAHPSSQPVARNPHALRLYFSAVDTLSMNCDAHFHCARPVGIHPFAKATPRPPWKRSARRHDRSELPTRAACVDRVTDGRVGDQPHETPWRNPRSPAARTIAHSTAPHSLAREG